MPFDLMLLIAQTVSLFLLTAWLTTGVLENVVHPELNSAFTAEVLDMTRMREDYPEAFERVAYRRVRSPGLQRMLFRLIVLWELIATSVLWTGTITLLLAMLDAAELEMARTLGLLGTLLFTCTWGGFLIAGNWFCYWFCHEGAQNTHFQMTLWGVATMILFAVA